MLIDVLDANGNQQRAVIQGQESLRDSSGTINTSGSSQIAIQPNPGRSGYLLQNCGQSPMYLSDVGNAAIGAGSFVINPGEFFPPLGYGVTTNAISIMGQGGDAYTAREW